MTEYGGVSFNRADMFYRIMYEQIITPLYIAFGDDNVEKIQMYLLLLIINNESFFHKKDDREKAKALKKKIKEIKKELPKLRLPTRSADVIQDRYIQKTEMISQMEDILTEVYDVMGNYNLRVTFVTKDTRLSVIKNG